MIFWILLEIICDAILKSKINAKDSQIMANYVFFIIVTKWRATIIDLQLISLNKQNILIDMSDLIRKDLNKKQLEAITETEGFK